MSRSSFAKPHRQCLALRVNLLLSAPINFRAWPFRGLASLLLGTALAFTACHSTCDEPSALVVPGARTGQKPLLINTVGTHGSAEEPWTIRVAEDGTLHVSRNRLYNHDTVSPMQWQARPGWCVFVENDLRVWAYDGHRNLWLLEVARSGTTTHGPTRFPCAVPAEMKANLSEAARQALR